MNLSVQSQIPNLALLVLRSVIGIPIITSFYPILIIAYFRTRDKKMNLGPQSSFDSNNNQPSTFLMNGPPSRRAGSNNQSSALQGSFPPPFSQDDSMQEIGFEGGREEEDEDQCYMCNTKKANENWIQCDQCDKWFHQGCVGITPENMPQENDKYYCPNCKRMQGTSLKISRGYSEFGNNILDDN